MKLGRASDTINTPAQGHGQLWAACSAPLPFTARWTPLQRGGYLFPKGKGSYKRATMRKEGHTEGESIELVS